MDLQDIKRRIFKDNKGNNVYMNVSVEEMDWLMEQAEENKINKTMLESSQRNTQAWVDKFNELEKKYDQALTVITSKKIMEMQEENKNLQADLKQANALLQWEEDYGERKNIQVCELKQENEQLIKEIDNLKQYKKILMENSVVRSKTIETYEKALKEINDRLMWGNAENACCDCKIIAKEALEKFTKSE